MSIESPKIHGASGVLTPLGYRYCSLPARRPAAPDRIERTAARWFPPPDLAAIEGAGRGHTLRRHVGVSDAALRDRARQTKHDASSFEDAATAQALVDRAFTHNQGRIAVWLERGTKENLRLDVRAARPIGRVYRYDRDAFETTDTAFVILKHTTETAQGYTVITAYPR